MLDYWSIFDKKCNFFSLGSIVGKLRILFAQSGFMVLLRFFIVVISLFVSLKLRNPGFTDHGPFDNAIFLKAIESIGDVQIFQNLLSGFKVQDTQMKVFTLRLSKFK